MQTLYNFFKKNILLCASFIIAILLLIIIEIKEYISKKTGINPYEAIDIINHKNGVIIDTRTEKHFKEKHIPNSINIPIEKLNEKNISLKKYKNKTIIIIQKDNFQAKNIIKILKNLNFQNTLYINNGLSSWEKEQLPIFKEKNEN